MKKILSIVTCGAILATIAGADITRVEMGAGAWAQKGSGAITYTENGATGSDTSSEEGDTSPYLWLLVNHPLPILPNLRVEYATIKNSGKAAGSFKEFSIAGVANSTLDMKQFDIIPYYNILDNTGWMSLDIGIDAKVAHVSYKATGNIAIDGIANTSYSESSSLIIPLLYARARVQIPTTEIALETDIKYITNGSSTLYDARIKVDYTLDFIPVVQPAVEVGYRTQKIKIDEKESDGKMDLTFSGLYAGLMLRF